MSGSLFAQGPFVSGVISHKGVSTIKAGWSGLIEAGVVYMPEAFTKDKTSFLGGSIKLPVWLPKSLNYDGNFFLAYFFTYTGGVFSLSSNETISKKQAFTSTYSFSPELIWFSNKIGISVPIEIGYGRSHLIQNFRNPVSNDLILKKGIYFSTGLRFYLFNNECPYTKGLKIGY